MGQRSAGAVTDDWKPDDDPDHAGETVVLLQEEVARLEAEIRDRDEALRAAGVGGGGAADDGPRAEDEALRRRLAEFADEIASRDETVGLLLEQSRLYEEAAAAQRTEWEQLHQWVDEVERRVEGKDAGDARVREDLKTEQARSESFRKDAESDRRAWEAQRLGMEREAQHLRGLVARRQPGAAEGEGETAFIAMAAENRRLRTANAALDRTAAEAEDLARRLDAAGVELANARAQLAAAEDDRTRERNEHEAEVTALRSRAALDSLRESIEPRATAPPPGEAGAPRPSPLDADERIRAFRQHLRELHEHEAEQRGKQSLSSRLSRLWRHTSPG